VGVFFESMSGFRRSTRPKPKRESSHQARGLVFEGATICKQSYKSKSMIKKKAYRSRSVLIPKKGLQERH